jgi:hypothetical protein
VESGHVVRAPRPGDAQVRVALHVQVEPDELAQEVELAVDDAMAEPGVPVPVRQLVVHALVHRVVGDVLVVVLEALEPGQRSGAQPRQQLFADLGGDRRLVQVDDHPALLHEVLGCAHDRRCGVRRVT